MVFLRQTQTITGTHPANRPPIQHDEVSMPFTLIRQTDIQMPMLIEETTFTALFVLEDDVPVTASSCSVVSLIEDTVLMLAFLDD